MTARQVGLLGVLSAIWGASYLLIKYALEDLEPSMIVFIRTALGAAVLYLVIRLQGGEARAALTDLRRRPWTAIGLGFLAITAPFLLISYGEVEVDSGLTAVLITPASLFVAAFAPLIDQSEKVGRGQAIGMVVGLLGVALLVGVETVQTLSEFLGAIAIIGAAACYALSSFVVKKAYRGMPSITTSYISVGTGALLTIPAAAFSIPHHAPGTRAVLSMVGLGVVGTSLAFVIFYVLIAEVGAGRASLISYTVPPISLIYGATLLHEHVGLAAVAGLVLIFAGVALAGGKRPGADAPPTPASAEVAR